MTARSGRHPGRSGHRGRRRHRVRPRGSGLQRGCGDGGPLPPASHLRSARRRAARRRAAARRHPVRQLLDRQHQRRLRPDLGPGEVDQPAGPRQPRGQRDRLLRLLQRPRRLGRARRPARQGLLQLRPRHLAPGGAQLELLAACPARPAPSRRAGCAPTSPRIPATARSPTGITRATARGTTAATPPCSRSGRRSHDAQAELLLSGHSHDYERFAPLDRNGDVDPAEASASSWSAPAVRSSPVAFGSSSPTARWHRTTLSAS